MLSLYTGVDKGDVTLYSYNNPLDGSLHREVDIDKQAGESMEKKLAFERSGEGLYETAGNRISVTAGPPQGRIVEFRLVVPGWSKFAPTGHVASKITKEIGSCLAAEAISMDSIDFRPGAGSGGCVLVRVSDVRPADPSSLAKFDEVTLRRSGRPKTGEFEVLLPAGSPLLGRGQFTFGELLNQMGRVHWHTAGHVAVLIAYAVDTIVARSSK